MYLVLDVLNVLSASNEANKRGSEILTSASSGSIRLKITIYSKLKAARKVKKRCLVS